VIANGARERAKFMSTQCPPKQERTAAGQFHWPSAFKMGSVLTLAILIGIGCEWVPEIAFLALMAAWGVLAFILLVRCLGWRDALVYGGVVVVTAFGFEIVGLYVLNWLEYRIHPQIAGVPLAILLGWFVGVSASFAFAAALLPNAGIRPRAILTSLLAVVFDLTADPICLAQGRWVWHESGFYAADVTGANGLTGIPWFNFLGWMSAAMMATIVFEWITGWQRPEARFRLSWSAVFFFALCLTGLTWAIGNQHWDLFFIPAVPLAVLAGWVIQCRLRFSAHDTTRER
jgi:uncharacterized membrane protein